MEKAVLVGVVCALMAVVEGDSSVCEGLWKIEKLEKCENHEKYPIAFDITKRKLDRETDCFSIEIEFPEDFGAEYGMRLETYEKCDGGFKASDVMTGGACEIAKQFAKENFEDVLGCADVNPRDCPIKKGKYKVKDYVINYKSLPKQGKCGHHKVYVFLTKNGEDQCCVCAYTSFLLDEED